MIELSVLIRFTIFTLHVVDNYRWCAAFYFLARLIILMLGNFLPQSSLKRALLEAACATILVVFLWLRPYKEAGDPGQINYSWINVSDAVLLTNLTFVAIFSSTVDENPKSHGGVKGIVNALAYVPLIVLGFVLYRAFDQYFRKNNRGEQTKFQFVFNRRRFQYGPNKAATEISTTSNIDDAATTAHTLHRLSGPDY